MRFFIEIIVASLLVVVAWKTPFQQLVFGSPPPPRVVPLSQTPQLRATPRGNWMWDPTRKTPLDRPAYDHKDNVAGAPVFVPVGTPVYVDQSGHRYWIDSAGQKHYVP